MPTPIFPTMSTDDPPTNEEIVGHNLACISDRLDVLIELHERISGHLFNIAHARGVRGEST